MILLSLIKVLLDILPLLRAKRSFTFCEMQVQLDCSKQIYARYVKLRGQPYISEISNKYCDDMTVLPFQAKPDLVILSLDDLGILGVSCVAEGTGPKPFKAPWYQYARLAQDSNNKALITLNVRHLNKQFLPKLTIESLSSLKTLHLYLIVDQIIFWIVQNTLLYPHTSGTRATILPHG